MIRLVHGRPERSDRQRGYETMRARILVAEDDRATRRAIVKALSRQGYEVEAVDNGNDADREIRQSPPDLVLLDVMLPGKNGLDICTFMKSDSTLKSIPVIILTCLTADSPENDGYWRERTAADDFLSKPFPVSELVRRVDRLLASRGAPGCRPPTGYA